ncbi:hypothetical protein OV079_04160 [Nannocystis pusilla]|uniref:Uncharacterized protein n=1 Tax=Nannocystis pusilla TaxID=889268 RepID=A0A9X3EKA7_9BACT|nr:hypothetical protein [Nannocystis pusilla]MCY1004779.1 hypothetical protein [Nannocystis pusilla]
MKTTLIIEIRAAEGGDDAKLLVHEQFAVYQSWRCGSTLTWK